MVVSAMTRGASGGLWIDPATQKIFGITVSGALRILTGLLLDAKVQSLFS
jgi:hypothetical protein